MRLLVDSQSLIWYVDDRSVYQGKQNVHAVAGHARG